MLQLPQVILNVVLQLSRTLPLHERSGSKLKHNSVFTTAKATELWRQFQALIELSLTFTKRHQCVKSVDKCSVVCAAKAWRKRVSSERCSHPSTASIAKHLTHISRFDFLPLNAIAFRSISAAAAAAVAPCLHPQHSAIEDVLNPVNPCLFIWLHKSPVYVYICTLRHSACMFSQHEGQGALLLLVRDTGLFANFHWVATDKEASVKMASLRRYTDQSRRHSNVTMATKIIVVANQKASAWLWS